MKYDISKCNFPEDLKAMTIDDLKSLAFDIRLFLLKKVSKTGGHLASNLGIVELAIAMHYVFDSPKDKFIWDVGHQSYVHKILTGRGDRFDTLRQFEGLSGFPKRNESSHDAFETGHSTTSLSAAFGIAKAMELNKEDDTVVAVIGDGALTGGMAYEALNNIGSSRTKMIIILNDNGMSIAKNTGSMAKHLTDLRTSKPYLGTKSLIKRLAGKSAVGKSFKDGLISFRNHLKYSMIEKGGIIFEELGFTYFGPIDGHNVETLIDTLQKAKKLNEPVIIHAITEKGKGYRPAEEQPNKFHGIGPFEVATGDVLNKSDAPTFSKVMGNYAVKMSQKDKSIVAITAAMGEATGLGPFEKTFPKRFFDVGIAEQHAVTFAAGLATKGIKPLVCIYSSFLQRSYDQLLMDVCMQNLPVVFAIDRAGCVGADGETHHGMFDIGYLSAMPNMTVLAPKDGNQLEAAMEYAFSLNSPVAIRYPRGTCNYDEEQEVAPYKGENPVVTFQGQETKPTIEILAVGTMYETGQKVAENLNREGYNVNLVNMVNLSQLHLKENKTNDILYVTIEDAELVGGFGQQFDSFMTNTGAEIMNFAWPKAFIQQGTVKQLQAKYGLDEKAITERILEHFERKA